MDFLTIFLIALALAVDAFAVALASGVILERVSPRHTFRLSFHFGLFQSLMNIIGWAAGLTIRSYIESVDHWLAFGLLALVAVRMIVEAGKKAEERKTIDPTRGLSLVMLSVATSIDSLAVGLSFAMLQISVWLPALVIGIVALALTAAGLHIGRRMGAASRLGTRAEIIGGLVLLGLGINILHQHGVF